MLTAPPSTPFNFISLGAGVQSSTLALMCAKGEVGPMPDGAIFADTQAEPASVYKWLDWLETQLPFPLYRVTKGSLTENALKIKTSKKGEDYTTTNIPLFTLTEDGVRGKIPNRSCTYDFKIQPIMKKVRELAGIKRGQKEVSITQYIGISWDEWHRCKPSRDVWSQSRWPLIELRMERRHCLEWMEKNRYPKPPRSSCVYCPFHSSTEWRRLQTEEPEEFQKAIQFEKDLQIVKAKTSDNFHSIPFLHRSCVPLDQIDFRSDFEMGQLDIFAAHHGCEEGMCGV
jgi:hypothetical protein